MLSRFVALPVSLTPNVSLLQGYVFVEAPFVADTDNVAPQDLPYITTTDLVVPAGCRAPVTNHTIPAGAVCASFHKPLCGAYVSRFQPAHPVKCKEDADCHGMQQCSGTNATCGKHGVPGVCSFSSGALLCAHDPVPVQRGGVEVFLNLETSVGGAALVEVQTVKGNKGTAVPGYSLDVADAMVGNFVSHHASWRFGTTSLPGTLEGETVRLRVALRDAQLFSVTLGCATSIKSDDTLPTLVGAHYFGGWERDGGEYSHWRWPWTSCSNRDTHRPGNADAAKRNVTSTGLCPLWTSQFPGRVPLLGNYTTDKSTVDAEIRTADAYGLSFFDYLWSDPLLIGSGSACRWPSDPNLRPCTDTALAWMLATDAWTHTNQLRFTITYSNDFDTWKTRGQDCFVGTHGLQTWDSFSDTWLRAFAHPRYLRVGGRPVFKILISFSFLNIQCGGNATLAQGLIDRLRAASIARGLGDPLVGAGWQNVNCGFKHRVLQGVKYDFTNTCAIAILSRRVAFFVSLNLESITISDDGAIPYCSCNADGSPSGEPCPGFSGNRSLPYTACSAAQEKLRLNHVGDAVPYVPNAIAGHDTRPACTREAGCNSTVFAEPTSAEWTAALRAIKAQTEDPRNRFGFPLDDGRVQPAFSICKCSSSICIFFRSLKEAVVQTLGMSSKREGFWRQREAAST